MDFLDAMNKAVNTSVAHFLGTNPDATIGEETPLLAAALQEFNRRKNAETYHEDIVAKIKELETKEKKPEYKALSAEARDSNLLSWDDSLYCNMSDLRSALHKERYEGGPGYTTINPSMGAHLSSYPGNSAAFWGQNGRIPVLEDYHKKVEVFLKAQQNLMKSQQKEEDVATPASPAQSEFMWGEESRAASPVASEYAWGEEIDYDNMDWFHDPRSPIASNHTRYNPITQKYDTMDGFGHRIYKIVSPPQSEYAWGPEDEEFITGSEYCWGPDEDEGNDVMSVYAGEADSEYAWGPDDDDLCDDDVQSEYAWDQKQDADACRYTSYFADLGSNAKIRLNATGDIVIEMKNWDGQNKQQMFAKCYEAVHDVLVDYMEEKKKEEERKRFEEREAAYKKEEEERNNEDQQEEEESDDDFESVTGDENSDEDSDFESVNGDDEEKEVVHGNEKEGKYDWITNFKDTKVYSKSSECLLNIFYTEAKKREAEALRLEMEAENHQTAEDVMEAVVEKVVDVEKKEIEEKLKDLIQKQELVATTHDIDEKMKLLDEILKMMAEDWFKNL